MNLFKTIFLFEWLQFIRQPVLALSLLLFFSLGCYSIYSGKRMINRQLVVIDSLQQSYQQDYKKALAAFTDTSTAEKKAQSKYAGSAAVVNFRLPQNAVNYPKPFASLSIGLRDINSYYKRIKMNVSFLDTSNTEISNPAILYAGNFDLAFVLVFLLPLLVIAFTYNVLSQEKEQGTHALLLLKSQSLHQIIIYKLVFRFLLIALTVIALTIVGIVFSKAYQSSFSDIGLWLFINIAWLFFWFALAYALVLLRKNSALSALYLLSAWLVFIIILPALSNIYISLKYPIPLRSDLASYERHIGEEIWEMNPKLLIDTFNQNNPKYLNSYDPAKDTVGHSTRFFAAYNDLKARKVLQQEALLNSKIQQGNEAMARLSVVNPVLKLQELLNRIARTGLADYRSFEQQTDKFQRKWKTFLYNHDLADQNLKPEDFSRFPLFKNSIAPIPFSSIFSGSLTLWLAGFIFLFIGFINSKNFNYHS